jgi:hypothetical protein
MATAAMTTVTFDLIDVITVTTDHILATMTEIDVIITATTAAMIIGMTDATTTITMIAMKTTAMIGGMTVVTTNLMTTTMIGVLIDVPRTTAPATATTTTARSALHHHHQKGGNPNGAFQIANREINFIVGGCQATKSNRQLRSNAREIEHVNTKTPQPLRWSEFPITFSKKDHWVHIPDPGAYPLVVNPIVDGVFLTKTLIDGGSNMNIIFTEMLRKMDFDFNKMTACDEPFYEVVPGKAAYPIGRVCLLVTFDTQENFRTEYLTFEVANFCFSYHAILGRPMLAKLMAIPHHTYLIMTMSVPNGILSILGDIMVSYNCETSTIEQWSWSLR